MKKLLRTILVFAVIGLVATYLLNVLILHAVRNSWVTPRDSVEYFQWDRWNAEVSRSRWHTEYELVKGVFENDSHEQSMRRHLAISAKAMESSAARSEVTITVYGAPFKNAYRWTLRAPDAGTFTENHGVETIPLVGGWRLALPTRLLLLETAGNTAFWGGAIWIACAAAMRSRRRTRQRAGWCTSCGYDRKGLAATAVCPECGAAAALAVADPDVAPDPGRTQS